MVQELPLIALTMGDGAGIGPEVCIEACLDAEVLSAARPFIIGNIARLELAAKILKLSVTFHQLDETLALRQGENLINVFSLDNLPADTAWGKVSAAAGNAAYEYLDTACTMAMRHDVAAIATAPLNKEALKLGGHNFPGHTEILAHLTKTDEVSMMLCTPNMNVIHVTTHIGLIDAIAAINPGLVERTVLRGHAAMQSAGIAEPRIGVCAINPHAGEGGLFGYGEEEEKIEPAIQSLLNQGINVQGPLPADTAFYLASRGDYDLIVAMYHDQGHGPVKVLGIESGTNVTVGLPVIRASVDHGTAFDIAGQGIADPRSMVVAVLQAAQLSRSAVSSPVVN